MNKRKTRLLIVDDHAITRMGLTSLLGSQPEFEITGDAGDWKTAVEMAAEERPDVVIMDLMMPGVDGAETTRRLTERWPEAKVLILTTFSLSNGIAQAIANGARGAILKSAELPELLSAIRAVADGRQWISEDVELMLKNDPPLPDLTNRQREILESITRGLSNKDIAKQLGISAPMVNEHINAIFAKLGAANRTEAVAIALRKHLLKI